MNYQCSLPTNNFVILSLCIFVQIILQEKMRIKYYTKLSNWELVKRSIAKYIKLNDSIAMGSVETIQNELNQVQDNINYVNKERELAIKSHANSIILSKIKRIEDAMNSQYRNMGFFQSLFGKNLDLSSEEYEISKLKSTLQDTALFSTPKNISDFINKCQTAYTHLINYQNLLNKSLPPAVLREKGREESIESKKKNLASQAHQKAIEQERVKALAAAHTNKTRQLAVSVKSRLSEQKNLLDCCPYCCNDLGSYPHADHIYPVAKGGLSTVENMVYVCQQCNAKKSDKTLFDFINSSSIYDFNIVIGNLKKLNKQF